jgi:hypothetical protein
MQERRQHENSIMSLIASLVCVLLVVGGCQDEPSKAGAPPMPTAPVTQHAATPPAPSQPGMPAQAEPQPGADDRRPETDEPAGEEGDEDSAEAGCAPEGSDLAPLQLLRFAFASGIEGKDPKDDLRLARRGQRVFAHLTLRNRSGRSRCVRLVFRVGGKKRTEVTLKIGESWSWRTWAYNTIKSDDEGPLELTVSDDQGQVILEKTLTVAP